MTPTRVPRSTARFVPQAALCPAVRFPAASEWQQAEEMKFNLNWAENTECNELLTRLCQYIMFQAFLTKHYKAEKLINVDPVD